MIFFGLADNGQACGCDGLANAAAALVGQVNGNLFCQLGELNLKNLLRVLEQDVSALTRGNASHKKHVLYIVEEGIVCNCISKICADAFIYLCGTAVALCHKLLYDLEGNYRKIVASSKINLRVAVIPDDAIADKKVYMPSDQAKELMDQNAEVKSLVKDFELEIK